MNFKKIIGIVSCKGGVGKSTLSINISALLSSFYFKKVGLLDADIYGATHSSLLNLKNNLFLNNKKKLLPYKKYNILSMSLSYFLKNNSSVLLRGPMITQTLNYFFKQTNWGNLDILFIDFPPGTGDIYLSLLRDINFDGVFLVTTPHIVSIENLKRSFHMLKKFNIKIYALLENMNSYKCINCEYTNKNIDNSNKYYTEFGILNIFKLPLNVYIGESCNNGIPFIFYNKCYDATLVLNEMCKLL